MKTDDFLDAGYRMFCRFSVPLAAVAALILGGCADMPSGAVIDDRTSKSPERRKTAAATNSSSSTSSTTTSKTTASTNTAKSTEAAGRDTESASANAKKQSSNEPMPLAAADPPGYYTVKKGDTLLKIAEQFGRQKSELSEWNALSDPNAIKVDQVLRVAPPDGAQVMSVPVDADMEIRRAGKPTKPSTVSQPSVRAVPLHKTAPLGQKIPYSDKAIADLERGEPGPVRTLEPSRKSTETPTPLSGRFVWPTEGKVVSPFDPTRKGIDIAGKAGQPVVAASDGKVLYAKNMRGYGNLIILEHADSMVTAYAHNKTILVREGQIVTQRQQIAEMGDSDADSVKLRFQIRHMGKPIDPVSLLPSADPASSTAR